MRAQNAQLNAEQDAAVSLAASQLVQHEMRDLFERFSGMSSEVARYLRQVRQALSELARAHGCRRGRAQPRRDDSAWQAWIASGSMCW